MQVFDFLEANGTAYIVMELLSGDTLENRISSQGKLSPAEIDRVLWPLLEGLERVHNAGFLHRDIKPANIPLDAAGRGVYQSAPNRSRVARTLPFSMSRTFTMG